MREITIGSKQIRVKAGALALLFYKQEFKTDLLGDMLKMLGSNTDPNRTEIDPSSIDILSNLQLVWAMAKSAVYPNLFSSFVEWIASLEDDLDLSDTTFLVDALGEATEGFFRQQSGGVKEGVPPRQ
ncbi:hypothetical protein ACIFOE_22330 [Paenibacillus sp. NRS-1783]|uniref:hypothetical protein n=1 Tax=Paenibacillus sp. NRS-1783 TaxID=3233907 RepID=UPI003D29E06E